MSECLWGDDYSCGNDALNGGIYCHNHTISDRKLIESSGCGSSGKCVFEIYAVGSNWCQLGERSLYPANAPTPKWCPLRKRPVLVELVSK